MKEIELIEGGDGKCDLCGEENKGIKFHVSLIDVRICSKCINRIKKVMDGIESRKMKNE